MKRLICFGVFILVLVILFFGFTYRVKNYELTYDMDDFNIYESFNKNDKKYYFKLISGDLEFDYVLDKKYSKKRRIVDKINVIEDDDTKCVSIKVDKVDSPYICIKDNEFMDSYLAGIKEYDDAIKQKEVNQIAIYKLGNYYLWNGYGLTDIIENKEYNFLKNESYDNNISYRYKEYLIIADYDSTREFSKFYIFNSKTKKIEEFEFEFKLSTSTYFMGDINDYIYLFDKKNKVQYRMKIGKKNNIEVTSKGEAAFYYDDKDDTISINKLVYNDVYFNKSNLVNYSLNEDKLYYNYQKSNQLILIDSDVSSIIYISDNDVYYLKKDVLYSYNYLTGKTKIMDYFEWNFSYNNKIFIFD